MKTRPAPNEAIALVRLPIVRLRNRALNRREVFANWFASLEPRSIAISSRSGWVHVQALAPGLAIRTSARKLGDALELLALCLHAERSHAQT